MIYGILFLLFALACLAGFIFLMIWVARKFLLIGKVPMNTETSVTDFYQCINQNLTVRGLIIGLIAMVMLIPLSMMQGVVNERDGLYRSVLADIGNTWGDQQLIQAPVLVVPFVEKHVNNITIKDASGKEKIKTNIIYTTFYSVHLPKTLSIDVKLDEQHRKRGIYNSLVYQAQISLDGVFDRADVLSLSEKIHRVEWDKAYVVLSLSDTRAINTVSNLSWNNKNVSYSPGTKITNLLSHGFHAKLGEWDSTAKQYAFNTKISVNGSQGFRFAPFGEATEVTMNSSWPHPSFQGMTLPTSHEVKKDGFNASWSISHLARNFPQTWVTTENGVSENHYDLSEFTAGVDLFEPVFLYSKMTRAVKYGLLFVCLTFLTFLIFELTTQARLHFVQYGLIGIALAIFYLVLLSIAEHTAFLHAYIIAALINISLITLYTAAALKNWKKATIIFALLSALYTVLYTLLQLEDYALLMGTMLLLSVLVVLMYVTRNLRVNRPEEDTIPQLDNRL